MVGWTARRSRARLLSVPDEGVPLTQLPLATTLDKPPVCPEQAGGMFNEAPRALGVTEELAWLCQEYVHDGLSFSQDEFGKIQQYRQP